MQRKLGLMVIVIAVAVLSFGIYKAQTDKPAAEKPIYPGNAHEFATVSELKEAEPKEECYPIDETIVMNDEDKSSLASKLATELKSVPAGTQTEIKLAHFDYGLASGTQTYSDGFGTYNFAVEKESDSWQTIYFAKCKLATPEI
jgi:hypothetical protein